MRRIFGWITLSVVVAACHGADPSGPGQADVASIELSPVTASFASLGATAAVSASPKDAGGNAVSATVSWSSSNTAVASASGGTITAVGNGTATITASSGSASATVAVTVQQVATAVSVTPEDGVIKAASSLTGSAVDARGNAIADEAITWTSLTPGILTVDSIGNLTPLDTGVGRIQVTSGSFSATALVRTVWNVQVLSDLFPLFEYTSAQGGRAAFSDEDQPNADQRGMILDQVWTYLETVLPNGGTANTEMFFTTWGEIWTEFTPFCSGQLIAPRTDVTNWTQCAGAKRQHFFTVENEPSDRFLTMRFTSRQFVLNSYFDSGFFPWSLEGYTQWLSAGDFQGGAVVVARPRAVSIIDFDTGDAGSTLTPLSDLVTMANDIYYADPQDRTPTAVKMAQSVMFFDYLNTDHPTVIPGILSMIMANPGAGVSNGDIVQFITDTTGMTLTQLDAAYLAHARAL